jgi:hypothetical protein
MITTNVDPSAVIPPTLMMETKHSFEKSVLKGEIRRHFPENGILQTVIILLKWNQDIKLI